jgi:hypothetical protein
MQIMYTMYYKYASVCWHSGVWYQAERTPSVNLNC